MPDRKEWARFRAELLERIPVGLTVSENEPLASHTTLRIGGPARFLVRCRRAEAVSTALRTARSTGIPWLVLGLGANVLVPDEGLDAVVLSLVEELAAIRVDGARVRMGGGTALSKVVKASLDAGLAGVECLGGIPSTVGGALAMNAGAYGQEILDVLSWAEVVEQDGTLRRLERWEIEGGYRWSVLGKGRIVTSAELSLRAEDPELLKTRVQQVREKRRGVLPPEPSAGSVFRNPPGDYAGRLLELAGCKGLSSGGAQVSQQHANVIVNPGGATAAGVRSLVTQMAARVRERFGVRLELELKILDLNGAVVADPDAALA
ncbi:MAG TPA: UDP-N-acetylmuramate dehydrogenase [Thermoanaerobaculaceae bacterium]|nr:UDP-N-acetylmuramate dehydrogenase [Thermoanaerobaculaceae bacterium]